MEADLMLRPILTTITPYRFRAGNSHCFDRWKRCVYNGGEDIGIRHILAIQTDSAETFKFYRDQEIGERYKWVSVVLVPNTESGVFSIARCFDFAAFSERSDWLLKWDVDCVNAIGFWNGLMRFLQSRRSSGRIKQEWFNIPTFYSHQESILRRSTGHSPIVVDWENDPDQLRGVIRRETEVDIERFTADPKGIFVKRFGGTQFLASTELYKQTGGVDNRFMGYGWEDYYQIYNMEVLQNGIDPLCDFEPCLENVTDLCRDVIAKPKALKFFMETKLFFIHVWHSNHNACPSYRAGMDENRKLLFSRVESVRYRDRLERRRK